MSKVGDIEPVAGDEFRRMLDAVPEIVAGMAYAEDSIREQVVRDWVGILNFLRETGCHPSILSRRPEQVERQGPHLRADEEGYEVVWNRKKTGRAMRLWVHKATGDWFLDYERRLSAGWKPYSRQWVWRIVRRCGAAAGIKGPVTPRRLRHTLGIEVTAKAGSGVAREALGVSDSVLLQYQRRTDEGAFKAMKEVRREASA